VEAERDVGAGGRRLPTAIVIAALAHHGPDASPVDLGPVAAMLFVKTPVPEDLDRTLRSAFKNRATSRTAQGE
jgi:hypothetical protein